MQRVHMIVHGSVQGVFFRANTRKMALSLGLKGYVRNMPDNTVEVVAEGSEDKIKELIEFCKKNPGASKVSNVNVEFVKASGEFKSFELIF